jgi:hypothetical protein
VPGIEAVVLGGSRARGTHGPNSDIDIGIYYGGTVELNLAKLDEAARLLDDAHRERLIAPPGGWDNWVNGGGWLIVDGVHVDLILRDIRRVGKAVEDCQNGIVTAHYQPGHPHAYLNAMYAGELAISRLIWDNPGTVAALKCAAESYPPAMKAAIVSFFQFEADFSCTFAQDNAKKGDAYYVAAHLVRSVSCMNQVLFALNDEYCLNEKRAVGMIDAFPIRPENYKDRVGKVFALFGTDPSEACGLLRQLVDDVRALA